MTTIIVTGRMNNVMITVRTVQIVIFTTMMICMKISMGMNY